MGKHRPWMCLPQCQSLPVCTPALRPTALPLLPCCSGGVGMNLIGADTVIFYDSGGWQGFVFVG